MGGTSSTPEEDHKETSSPTRDANAQFCTAAHGNSNQEERQGGGGEDGEEAHNDAVLDRILFRKNPDDDTMGFKAVLEALSNPQSYLNFRSALRITLFVSFPLFTIGVHPNTIFKTGFICMLIAAVLSTSTCRSTLGEHIGLHTWTIRGILYMFIFSEVAIASHLEYHPAHWWGLIAAGIFLASFTSDANIRRFMFLYFFLFMMEAREFVLFIPVLPENNGRWLAGSLLIGIVLGIASNLLPYPTTLASVVDTLAGKLFTAVGSGVHMMNKMVWSDDVHVAAIFFYDKTLFDRVEYYLGLMPTLLWFTNWEPLEFALRNSIRRLKFSFLRRILSLVYASFSVGTTLVNLKREQRDRVALQKVRQVMWENAFGIPFRIPGDEKSDGNKSVKVTGRMQQEQEEGQRGAEGEKKSNKNNMGEYFFFQQLTQQYGKAKAEEMHDELWGLRSQSKKYSTELGNAVKDAVIAIALAPCTPREIVENVEFDAIKKADAAMRHHLRHEVLVTMKHQRELVTKRKAAAQATAASSSSARRPSPTEKEERYETLVEYQNLIDDSEVFIRLNTILFHMLLSMIAGEVVAFGEQMRSYKPECSLRTRLWRFFVVEPWHDFWEEVWSHLTLARPADWRILKDAIKVTCAYMAACALNFQVYVISGGMYYFGTTILLGLPVEEESLSLAVNRLAGNSIGCALGFMAYNNFHNLQTQIAMALFFIFLLQLFKNHPTYGQTFFYGSIMVPGGVATSLVPIDLLTRLLFSCYTICAYLLCFLFIFPTNPMKVLFGYRVKLSKLMSEIIDLAALTAHYAAVPNGEGGRREQPLQQEDGTHRGGRFDSSLRNAPFGEEDANVGGPTREAGGGNPLGSSNPASPTAVAAAPSPLPLKLHGSYSAILCGNLSDHLLLARRVIGMCNKWTPFAARQHVIRGMLPFPEAASFQLHQSFLRLMAQLDLLAFGAQLLHRPRPKEFPFRPFMIHFIRGALHDFLYDFSNSSRVLIQNIIDSTQQSRKWDYEHFLRRCGRLSKLKVVAHAVMYEYYVMMAEELTSSDPFFYSTAGTKTRRPSPSRAGPSSKDPSSSPLVSMDSTAFHELRNEMRKAQHAGGITPDLIGASAASQISTSYAPAMPNGAEDNSSEHPPTARTIRIPSIPQGKGGEREKVQEMESPLPPLPHFLPPLSSPSPPSRVFHFAAPFVHFPMNANAASRFQSKDPDETRLDKEIQVQQHSFAYVISAPSSPMDEDGGRRGKQQRRGSAGGSPGTPSNWVSDGERNEIPAEPISSWLNFSYYEDTDHLPRDTDLLAVSAILGGCEGFIVEMEHIGGHIKTISDYHRQLHESSLLLPLIDKISNKMKRHVDSVYLSRHYNLPLDDLNYSWSGAHHVQNDVYKAWYF